jgi:phenylacetate-CoA ligase
VRIYEPLFRNLLYPAYERLRGRRTAAWLREYQASQWLHPEQVRALQWRKLVALVQHCWEQVPFYRRRWQALGFAPGDLRSLADYARLPLLTKADIRENLSDLTAASHRAGLLFKATGGSTGEPLRFAFTRESNDRRAAVMWRGYGWTGAPLGRRALFIWGGAVGDPARSARIKDRLYHGAFNRRMLNSFAMRDDNLAEYADAIEAFRPEVVVGYVGPTVRLAQWLVGQGRSIAGVRSVLGAAEALHDFQRPVLEAAFAGARAYNTYGCREFMLIACECEQRDGLHVNADHLVVELLDARTGDDGGRTGELAITDLHNWGMPFIRYVNGDVASEPADPWSACACGRGLPRLSRIDGRRLDAIRTPDGRVLPGEFFPHMLKDVAGVRRFQVVQERLDALTLSLVPGPEFGAAQDAWIRREVGKVLGDGIRLELRLVDDIPLTASGKLRVTVSRLP